MKKDKFRSVKKKFNQALAMKLVFMCLLLFLVFYFSRNLMKLPYFNIQEVIVRDGAVVNADKQNDFFYLKGKNIFSLDLRKEAKYIQEKFPAYRRIRLVRFLPNKLCVDFIRRKIVACLKSNRNLCVDENMIIFEGPLLPGEKDIPLISGIEKRFPNLKPGRRYNAPELAVAFLVIREKNLNPALKNYKLIMVDVSNTSNITLFFPRDLQVKINNEFIKDKIDILGNLLIQVSNSIDKIEYIDLRFNEPVIKLKNPV